MLGLEISPEQTGTAECTNVHSDWGSLKPLQASPLHTGHAQDRLPLFALEQSGDPVLALSSFLQG